jgi:hypothetical protein
MHYDMKQTGKVIPNARIARSAWATLRESPENGT